MSSSSFEEKLKSLQERIDEGSGKSKKTDLKGCVSTTAIIGAAIPFVVCLVLVLWKPKIVQRKEGTKVYRDKQKIFFWTVGITVVSWIALYITSKYISNKMCVVNKT